MAGMSNIFLLFTLMVVVIGRTSSQCPPYEIECGFWCCPSGAACIDHQCRTSFAVRIMRSNSKDEPKLDSPNELNEWDEILE